MNQNIDAKLNGRGYKRIISEFCKETRHAMAYPTWTFQLKVSR